MATRAVADGEHVATADQRVVTYQVPWAHYEAQLALRGEAPVPRACTHVRLVAAGPQRARCEAG